MNSLIEKLGENLAKVRQAAEEAILVMCNHPAFGPKLCVNWIIKLQGTVPISKSMMNSQTSLASKKTMNSNKLIIGKYLILSRILSEVEGLPLDVLRSTLPFTVQGLTHSLQDVRQPAGRCMVELYRVLGNEVRNHFSDLRVA